MPFIFLNRPFRIVMNAALLCLLSACVMLRTESRDTATTVSLVRQNILAGDQLSEDTAQIIRMAGLTQTDAIHSGGAFLDSETSLQQLSSFQRDSARAEIQLARALQLEQSDPDQAAESFMKSAQVSLTGMLRKECSLGAVLPCDNFKLYYHRSVIGLIEWLKNRKWQGGEIPADPDRAAANLELIQKSKFESLATYDSITPAAFVHLLGLLNKYYRYGIGVPLTACREKQANDPFDKYLSAKGTCVPLTAVLTFPKSPTNKLVGQLQILNTLEHDEVTIEGRSITLAANLSAPFATLIEKTGLTDYDGFFSAMSGNELLASKTGFYTIEPYDPNKIPLVTVHGLFSSPATWLSLHNDLMGDPRIRKHFQIWHYLYSTNLPILENARIFREKLDELEANLRRYTRNPAALQGMVVIAHSMGGILTRTAVAKDSSEFRKYFFGSSEPSETLDEESKELLHNYFDFQRKPYIARAIFIAVPHKGSEMSDTTVGWIGRKITFAPKRFVKRAHQATLKIQEMVRPELRSTFDNQDLSSVRGLSPSNPALIALAQVAVDSHVPFHSIIGNRGMELGELSSDGVVAYKSSHLEGAQSELIVSADHAAHLHPLAVSEIKRILYLHLDSLNSHP